MQRWAARNRILFPFSPYSRCRNHSAQAQKVVEAVVDQTIPHPPLILSRRPAENPFTVLAPELLILRSNLLTLLGSAHPHLQELAKAYFDDSSRLVRSAVILLFARATNPTSPGWSKAVWNAQREDSDELDQALTRPEVLHYCNPNMPDHAESFDTVFALRDPPAPVVRRSNPSIPLLTSALLPTQLRLAQIVEMVNVASLLHDQVTASPTDATNKLCILGGDFLLGRACAALSRLNSHHVVELIASVISNLSEGHVALSEKHSWEDYLQHVYLKSGSLVAKGMRSAVVLAGGSPLLQDVAYAFGRNIGMTMQLLERASADGDVRCWETAGTYSKQAADLLQYLPESESRRILEVFVDGILKREMSAWTL